MWKEDKPNGFGVYSDINFQKILGVWFEGSIVFSFLMDSEISIK